MKEVREEKHSSRFCSCSSGLTVAGSTLIDICDGPLTFDFFSRVSLPLSQSECGRKCDPPITAEADGKRLDSSAPARRHHVATMWRCSGAHHYLVYLFTVYCRVHLRDAAGMTQFAM